MKQITCTKCGKEINSGFVNLTDAVYCIKCFKEKRQEFRASAYLQFKGGPGPWQKCAHTMQVRDSAGSVVCNFPVTRGIDTVKETEANVRLTAAAYDLLSAAQMALKEWGTLSQRPETFRALDVAIRKALGNE